VNFRLFQPLFTLVGLALAIPALAQIPPEPAPSLASPMPRELAEKRPASQLSSDAEIRAQAAALYAEALRIETRTGLAEALPQYQELLKLDPQNTEAQLRVGRYYLQNNKISQALTHFQSALQANPDAADLQAMTAYLQHRRGAEDEALVLARSSLEKNPSLLIAYRVVFEILAKQNKLAEAQRFFSDTLNQTVDSPSFWMTLGRLYYDLLLNQPKLTAMEAAHEVIPFYKKALLSEDPTSDLLVQIAQCEVALGDKTAALGHLREAIALDPSSARLLEEVADYELSLGERHQARLHYEDAHRLQPDLPDLREKLVRLYLDENLMKEAVPVLNELADQAVLQPKLHPVLAKYYLQALQPERAEFHARRAIELAPELPGLYVALAWSLINQQKHETALTELAIARKKFPGSPDLVYWEGVAFRQIKKYAEALESYRQARILSSGLENSIVNGDFYCEYALTLELAGQKDQVEAALKDGLKKEPRHSNILNSLAYFYAEENFKLEEALTLSKQSLVIDPGNGAYLDTLGWIYFKLKRFKEAAGPLQQAVVATKEDPVVMDHLAQIYVILNRLPEAVELWKKAVVAAPQKEDYKKSLATAEQELKSLQVSKSK
jgi:tetratricopeptide (TPR) repeat protein